MCSLTPARTSALSGKTKRWIRRRPHSRGVESPSAENIGENGLFKAPEILKKEFEAVLAGRATENVINYCGSGVTACCNHLAMRVAGLRDAGVYVGSWSEWVADENRPVATGDN